MSFNILSGQCWFQHEQSLGAMLLHCISFAHPKNKPQLMFFDRKRIPIDDILRCETNRPLNAQANTINETGIVTSHKSNKRPVHVQNSSTFNFKQRNNFTFFLLRFFPVKFLKNRCGSMETGGIKPIRNANVKKVEIFHQYSSKRKHNTKYIQNVFFVSFILDFITKISLSRAAPAELVHPFRRCAFTHKTILTIFDTAHRNAMLRLRPPLDTTAESVQVVSGSHKSCLQIAVVPPLLIVFHLFYFQ